MPTHKDFGEMGEELAAGWLIRKGYTILHRNWRQGRYEMDIIAFRKHILHFIEVKTRSSGAYGHPEENITHEKIRNMMRAAAAFLYRNPGWKRIQYDVLAISRRSGKGKDPQKRNDPKKESGAEKESDAEKKSEAEKESEPEYEYFLIEDVYL